MKTFADESLDKDLRGEEFQSFRPFYSCPKRLWETIPVGIYSLWNIPISHDLFRATDEIEHLSRLLGQGVVASAPPSIRGEANCRNAWFATLTKSYYGLEVPSARCITGPIVTTLDQSSLSFRQGPKTGSTYLEICSAAELSGAKLEYGIGRSSRVSLL